MSDPDPRRGDRFVAGEDEMRPIGEQIAEGYRRIPQGEHDEWGDLEAAAEGAHRRTLGRLGAQERPAAA